MDAVEPKREEIIFSEEPCNVLLFKKIVNEMTETFKCKNADYGNAYGLGYQLFGTTQLLSRIHEKFMRVYNLLHNKELPQVKTESVVDTLSDMSVQCIILRMIIEGRE